MIENYTEIITLIRKNYYVKYFKSSDIQHANEKAPWKFRAKGFIDKLD